ncbi:MAG: SpoIIE family protein phosphatase [Leptospira sp.]|nr:SpoIIE family protein phosphatase [Leptospira sp.]NCS95693.1 SpoIIE family protein phosphatase [Leptospira sp.]
MSTENSNLPTWFNRPEISAKRVSGIMQYFIRERKIDSENPFSEFLDDESFSGILNDKNLWIPQELEDKIFSFLASLEDIAPAIYQLGKETFLSQSYELLPTNESSLQIQEIISRFPVLLSKLTRTVYLDILELSESKALFQFYFREPFKERWYDVIFFKGMLDGLALLFELQNANTHLRETRLLGIHTDHKDLGENILFGADRNIYEMQWTPTKTKLSRTFINQEELSKAQKSFVISRETESDSKDLSVINVASVITKSRELALENRDLEAAVEILKSFKTELEIKQKSIAKDLKLAKNIQKGIIPQTIPDWKGIQFWNHFSPMQEVSGDYYDYFQLDDDKIGIAICDVSGHGVPAAFITALSKMLFNMYRNPSPSNIFKNINRDLLELLMQQGYTTCIYAVIDRYYNITYSIAGHPRPILLSGRTAKASLLQGEGTFLGMFPEASDHYEDNYVVLEPGDKIFFYTDGLTEAENDQAEAFGDERLLEIIEKTAGMNIQKSIEYITQKHNEFCMGTDQMDDITILGFSLNSEFPKFESLVQSAKIEYKKKNFVRSSQLLKDAHDILPRDLNAILLLCKSLAREKKYKEAILFLEEYSSYKLHNYETHNILGYCYFMIQEFDKAEIELKKSLYMNDAHPSIHYNLARTYFKKEDPTKMSIAIERLRKFFPKFLRLKELDSLLKSLNSK